jgi:hypothetical protein
MATEFPYPGRPPISTEPILASAERLAFAEEPVRVIREPEIKTPRNPPSILV